MTFRLAHRIAVNRTIAGVHFPVDSAAGAVLGCMIGEAAHSIAKKKKASGCEYSASGTSLDDDGDFTQVWLQDNLKPKPLAAPQIDSPLLAALWEGAEQEWK